MSQSAGLGQKVNVPIFEFNLKLGSLKKTMCFPFVRSSRLVNDAETSRLCGEELGILRERTQPTPKMLEKELAKRRTAYLEYVRMCNNARIAKTKHNIWGLCILVSLATVALADETKCEHQEQPKIIAEIAPTCAGPGVSMFRWIPKENQLPECPEVSSFERLSYDESTSECPPMAYDCRYSHRPLEDFNCIGDCGTGIRRTIWKSLSRHSTDDNNNECPDVMEFHVCSLPDCPRPKGCEYYDEPLRIHHCIGTCGRGVQPIRWIPKDNQPATCVLKFELENCLMDMPCDGVLGE